MSIPPSTAPHPPPTALPAPTARSTFLLRGARAAGRRSLQVGQTEPADYAPGPNAAWRRSVGGALGVDTAVDTQAAEGGHWMGYVFQ